MSFEFVTEVTADFVRLTATGKYTFEGLLNFIALIKKESDRTERANVLIDCLQVEGNMTEAERFQGGQRIAQVFGPRIKAAVLMQAERTTKLGELAAVNRGAKFLVTDSEDEALKWLLGNGGTSNLKSRSQVS
jgi:hypothetical protein